jgi:hypothetical protein
MACHTVGGYFSMKRLLQRCDLPTTKRKLDLPHSPSPDSPYVKYMPPLVGSPGEIDALAVYPTPLSHPNVAAAASAVTAPRAVASAAGTR